MKEFFLHYVIKKEKVTESEKLTREMFDQLRTLKPEYIKHSVFKMGENVFIHIARFANEEANLNFSGLPAFINFKDSIKGLLMEESVLNEVREILTYPI